MKEISSVFNKIAQRELREDEYIDFDSKLIYCRKCNTPRQQRYTSPQTNTVQTLPALCKCLSIERDEENRKRERDNHFQLVTQLRSQGIRDKKILEWTFANDNGSTPNMEKAKNYVDRFERMKTENMGLLLWGNVGTGKSFVAGCIANALIDKKVSVCMTNFGVILADMMNLKIDKNEYIQDLNKHTLLIIDDFGMERDTPFALEQIYNVIDRRYTACKPLIVTTNLTLEEMQNTALQTDLRRIYDRILEMCVPIRFEGESKRKGKAEEKLNKLREILD